jgi:hypothetical protein
MLRANIIAMLARREARKWRKEAGMSLLMNSNIKVLRVAEEATRDMK